MRPDKLHIGSTLYWVIRTYNDSGVLTDADSTPTVAVRKNGASVGDSVTVSKRAATTGIYDCSYNPSGEAEGDMYTLEESVTISSQAYENNFEVTVLSVERGTDGAATNVYQTPLNIGQTPRNIHNGVVIYEGETAPVSISNIKDSFNVAIDLSSYSNLLLIITEQSGEVMQTVTHANLTVSGADNNTITFTNNSTVSEKGRGGVNLDWSLRDADNGNFVIVAGKIVLLKTATPDS